MDIDTIKKLIQEFFQEGTVTIVGSGLSLAEGIPGMWELAKELRVKVPGMLSTSEDEANWEAISNDLTSGVGLEQALHNTKPNSTVEECIRKVTAIYISEAEKCLFEDIVRKGKQLRFSEYLQQFNIRNQGMTVITTNYDRLIEYACEVNDIMANTLFVGKYISRFKPDESKYASCIGVHRKPGKRQKLLHSPMVTVLKPHGCLSWHLINGIPYSIPNCSVEDSLIITPGLNKYREGYSVPFDAHRAKANEEIDKAQRYIIIGYGFGDDHLETHLMQQLRAGKPTLIFTHSLSVNAEKIVKECSGITAFCHVNSNDTRVLNGKGESIMSGVNLWDLHEMIKEVF